MHERDEKFAFVDHLVAEHRRLDHLLVQSAAVIRDDAGGAKQWLPRLTATVTALRCELAQHFGAENQGGCLEEAAARCPAVSLDVRRLVCEQDELIERLDEMLGRCQTTTELTTTQVGAIEQELRLIVSEVRRHETQESRVVERGFSVNLLDEDAAANDSAAEWTRA
jgi:hypothetical protein